MQTLQGQIRIGTRGSALALVQAHLTRDLLMAAHGLSQDDFKIEVISTSGVAGRACGLCGSFDERHADRIAAGA
jgi:Porphobilinogen deaminase, dipyromethane cofactor binding domain